MSARRDVAAARKGPPDVGRLAAVRRVPDERAYLYELIQTIGGGPDLETILRGVVSLVTEATTCHACFIYFLRDDGLVLRSASSMYEHLEGTVVIPLGEGLTGWVARARRSAFIKERALEDPRVRRAYFPELGDEVYQSLVSVPIFARAGEVLGVITLHAEAPHEFVRADLDFLEHTASLIGGAVENARLYEDATARVALLSDLSRLSRRIASAGSQQDVLRNVADGVRGLLQADRAEIHVLDPDGRLRLAVSRPDREAPAPVDARSLWLVGLEASSTRSDPEEVSRLATALWGENLVGVPMIVPLIAGSERLGVLGVVLPDRRVDAEVALAGVAAHTAVALKQHQVIERLREENLVKDFFQTLARAEAEPGQLADLSARLGVRLEEPHLVISVVPWKPSGAPPRSRRRPPRPRLSWPDLASQVEARLTARFPGSLLDTLERSIRVLVPLAELSADEAIASVSQMDWGEAGTGDGLSVGVSNLCRGAGAFARGLEEATSAAEVGALIRGRPGVTTYEGLGPYRYVLGSEGDARDPAQQRLELLVEYDRRRSTQLLDTLEGYLDHRGNVVGTSRVLFVHANTLRQRLDRIRQVSGIDLERDDWLSLAVATKAVKLRRMRGAAREEGGNDG